MAKYPLTDRLDLQLNVYNLTDEYYYDQIHPAHIVPGPATRHENRAALQFGAT